MNAHRFLLTAFMAALAAAMAWPRISRECRASCRSPCRHGLGAGGRFIMGSADPMFPDARPLHAVRLNGFFMDRCLVTNAQFDRFVRATGYVTVAERKPDPRLFPGVPPEKLVPGAVVFVPPPRPVSLDDVSQWWRYVPGASWRHPQGRPARWRAWQITRLSRSAGRTPPPTPAGPASVCRPRRNGNGRRGAGWTRSPLSGAARFSRRAVDGKHVSGPFPRPEHARRRLRGNVPGGQVSAQRFRAVRHGRERLGMVRRLVPA